jgi:hypothetical protein
MEAPLWTEQQMEQWLKHETRTLTMPDGSRREHTAFKLVWDTADALVEEAGYTHAELIAWALEEAELQNASFDLAYTGVVKYLDDERRRAFGLLNQ